MSRLVTIVAGTCLTAGFLFGVKGCNDISTAGTQLSVVRDWRIERDAFGKVDPTIIAVQEAHAAKYTAVLEKGMYAGLGGVVVMIVGAGIAGAQLYAQYRQHGTLIGRSFSTYEPRNEIAREARYVLHR